MGRIIDDQTNIWGKQLGADAQRSDLWIVNFNEALRGMATALTTNVTPMTSGARVPFVPPKLATYFARSVAIPDLKLKSEPIRRDSKPFPMPSWDEPLDPIRMNFLLDCFRPGGATTSPYRSDIYQMLEAWRAVVRAGRGGMSNEFSISLNGDYRIDYAFDVWIMLLRPSSSPTVSSPTSATANQAVPSSITNDLEFSLQLRLINCWLSSFRLTELNYEGSQMMQIETVFYAEDVRQEPQSAA